MKRTQFEESLISNANQAHAECRARQVPAIIGVPAYLTGWAFGTAIGAVASRLPHRAAR